MTAVFAGMLVLGGAFWLSSLMVLIELPKAAWSLGVSGLPDAGSLGDLATGTAVTFTDGATPAKDIGTGVVRSIASRAGDTASVTVAQVKSLGGSIPDAKHFRWGASVANISEYAGIPVFSIKYLELGVATAIIIAGTVLIYWLAGRRPGSVDFLVAVDGEMKKVNWSTKRVIQNSTSVVILASFLLAGALFIIDWGFGLFFQGIGVMPGK